MWPVQVFSKPVLHLPAAISHSSSPGGGNAASGPAQRLRRAQKIPDFQTSNTQVWRLRAPYGTLIRSSQGWGHRAVKPPFQTGAAALPSQRRAYFGTPPYNWNHFINSIWGLYEIGVIVSMPQTSRQKKDTSSCTREQLPLLCSWQHKPQASTGLTFSFSSISASDSSNQRSKSGARKSGRFSCLVSLSHQLLSFFCTVMFSCLWVTLHTGWGEDTRATSAEVLRSTGWSRVDTWALPIKEAGMTWTSAAQASRYCPSHW